MKRKKIMGALMVTLCLMGLQAKAQQIIELAPGPVIYISDVEDGQQMMMDVFNETQSPYFHDPQAPRFILTDRRGKWALGIGGYIQTKAEFDFDKIVNDIDFYPSEITTSDAPANSQTQMDITTSTVFLKLIGRTNGLGNFILYTAGNWRGAGNTFQLLNAYMQFMGFTVGYNTGMFMDLAACPPTIDYAGPCGMTFYRSTQIGWEYSFNFGLSMGIGVETLDVSGTVNPYESIGAQRFPNVPLYFQYAWNKNSHFRVGGILRDITYTDLISNKDSEKVGWGAQASLVTTLGSKITLFGQYTIGEGIGELMNDISNLAVDIVPNPNENGSMMLLLNDGWYGGIQYDFAKNMFASATYSQSSLHSRNGYSEANPTQYKRGQYVVGNVFWNVTPYFQVGLEYLHGWRTNFNDKTYNANRINLSAKYSF